jgi:hypothetical protein
MIGECGASKPKMASPTGLEPGVVRRNALKPLANSNSGLVCTLCAAAGEVLHGYMGGVPEEQLWSIVSRGQPGLRPTLS